MAETASVNIDSTLNEQRKFECPDHFRQQAHIQSLEEYERIYRESVEQPEKFWGRIAEELHALHRPVNIARGCGERERGAAEDRIRRIRQRIDARRGVVH